MASRKRARSASSSASSSSAAAAATVVLSGGHAHPPSCLDLWRAETLCDVRVQAGGGTPFAAHRLVLAAGSTTLRGLLTSTMRDQATPALPEVPSAAFASVLEFLYTGACEADESLLPELLRAADFLDVAPLKDAAVDALKERLDPSNALRVWAIGVQLEAPALAAAAKETALFRFEELGDTLSTAPLAQVHELLADEWLTAESEEAVFSAVARWAEVQQPAPAEGALLGLMRHVRFAQMRLDFMQQKVFEWPLLDTKAGQKLLRDALAPFVGTTALAPRLGFGPRALYVLGGDDGSGGSRSSVEIYDPQSNTWTAGAAMGSARSGGAAAMLGGKLYVLGGREDDDDNLLSSVEVFDPQSGAWSAVAPMSTKRVFPAAAALGGRLYAIGGCNEAYNDLISVEAFDPQMGVWEAVAPMPTARNRAGAAVLGGKIYVVGGFGDYGGTHLSTVVVYDPATNSWAAAAPMPMARCALGVAALGGKIYAAGGSSSSSGTLSTVEAYDPQSNTWSAVAPMSTRRETFGLAEVRGKLYAIGGTSGTQELATAEAYDPQRDRWRAVAPMSGVRPEHAIVAM